MSNTRLQSFRSFLTERFTSVAVEIFGEVQTIVEAYSEENKRLRNILHMVVNPEIRLSRIDVDRYPGATAVVREQPPEMNTVVKQEISEPLAKKPKEEQIECEISWNSEQKPGLGGTDNTITSDYVKDDLEEREINRASTGNHICVVEYDSDNSSSLSTEETNDECEDSFLDSRLVTDSLTPSRSEESTTKSWEPHMHSTSTQTETSDHPLQKTMLELPRMMPCKPFMAVIPDSQSFLARITEAYKDVPDDNKPLITKMDLTADLELVDCAFGKVPKGCPLSYQCPLPSSKDYKTYDDAPPQPLLPMTYNRLEPMPPLSTLSASEQEHVNVMQITWEESHSLEHSTRACKKTVQELQRLRLTGRFKEICKLKPEQSNVDHLISKIQKGSTRCKNTQIEEEMKTEALREYCQNLCVNWYPCGLVIHPNAPWLGAVPDGLVYDPNEKHRFGLVHVKCIGFSSLIQCAFLTCRDGVLQLKTGHSLYWHIQGQMMVTGTSWCDLFVFSKEDLLVQRVYRDTTLIKVMEKNLHDFFFRHYLPHLFKTEVSP